MNPEILPHTTTHHHHASRKHIPHKHHRRECGPSVDSIHVEDVIIDAGVRTSLAEAEERDGAEGGEGRDARVVCPR
jgi:hypothetical protein